MRALAIVAGLAAAAPLAGAVGVSAQGQAGAIDVIEVSGAIDQVMFDFIRDRVRHADARTVAIVVELDTPGGLVPGDRVVGLAEMFLESPIPVVVWVGPGGAEARSAGVLLLVASHRAVMAPDTWIGEAIPFEVGARGADDARILEEIAGMRGRRAGVDALLDVHRGFGADDALAAGVIDAVIPDLGSVVTSLHGLTLQTNAGPVTLTTAREIEDESGTTRLEPIVTTRFFSLSAWQQLLHVVASPAIAYLLLVVGFSLMVFEFFTSGIGLAGIVGGICQVLAFYGFSVLPTNWTGVVLVVAGIALFVIDVQAAGLGMFTIAGALLGLTGSYLLFTGPGEFRLPLWLPPLAVGGLVLFFVVAMTAVVRARFSTPTIGRESMIGMEGTAREDVAPEGTVMVRGALWKGRVAYRAAEIRVGDRIVVTGVEGLVLEVAPATTSAAQSGAGDEKGDSTQ